MVSQKREAILNKIVEVAQRLGNMIYLRSMRDGLMPLMPLFILAGLAILINSVFLDPTGIMKNIIPAATMTTWQNWGNLINNASLNIVALLFVIGLSYALAKNRGFNNVIGAIMTAFASFIALAPQTIQIIPVGAKQAVNVSGVLSYALVGSKGIFAAIIAGILATELFIHLSNSKRLQIHLGENIPPAVGQAFESMLPLIITVALFAFVSFLIQLTGNDLMSWISTMIQEPLRGLGTSLPGYLLIVFIGNLLFGIGIHQSIITGPILDPLLLVNMNANMAAFAAGKHVPYIINGAFRQVYGDLMGGSGNTIALIIAIFIFSKYRPYRDLSKMALAPNLFNINEPIIFGIPIVFNLPLIIPFALSPIIGSCIGYFGTALGLINPCVVAVPWITPPIISGFLATAGDWRAAVAQIIIIAVLVLFYLPFLKISERIAVASAAE